MALLEKRRAALAAEGLFDPARKKPIPYLPKVIGVVTSPSGAVIRDILHRLRDRFPRHVLIWPVAVQGQSCAAEVAAAIRGFNAIAAGGPIPRPDLIIVARGGGSLEDLMGFNDEAVVRAAAASKIPLISAVGHETDTTLIDHAADLRAPTPTAAAEMAVPVRADLIATLADLAARQSRASRLGLDRRDQRLRDLSRALPRLEALMSAPAQRFDAAVQRLGGALGLATARKRSTFQSLAAPLRPALLAGLIQRHADRLARTGQTLDDRAHRQTLRAHVAFDKWAPRLAPALTRLIADTGREIAKSHARLDALTLRLNAAPATRLSALTARLEALDRLRQTLGYAETLRRGYAVVWADGAVATTKAQAEKAQTLSIEFQDGRLASDADLRTRALHRLRRLRHLGQCRPVAAQKHRDQPRLTAVELPAVLVGVVLIQKADRGRALSGRFGPGAVFAGLAAESPDNLVPRQIFLLPPDLPALRIGQGIAHGIGLELARRHGGAGRQGLGRGGKCAGRIGKGPLCEGGQG
jgi:exodeoxyribonuclease VII large subunit